MEWIKVLTLGVVQGLTEFLPVSSSGHLVIFQHLFGMREPELLLDICLHVGTLFAVVVVFFPEIRNILGTVIRFPVLLREAGGLRVLYEQNEEVRITAFIIAGSVPTAFLGVLFSKYADLIFGSLRIVGSVLILTGTFLWLTRFTSPRRSLKAMTVWDALIVGLVQGLAIIPGISRSGATIATALFLGIDRKVAGRYSFLLAIPAILGALVLGLDTSVVNTSVAPAMIAMGTLTAGIVGYLALVVLLRIVDRGRLYYFAPYCVVVGCSTIFLSF